MAKKILNENELKIINEVKDAKFMKRLTEGFQNGSFMTTDEFCQRLERLKTSLIKKHRAHYGNNNS